MNTSTVCCNTVESPCPSIGHRPYPLSPKSKLLLVFFKLSALKSFGARLRDTWQSIGIYSIQKSDRRMEVSKRHQDFRIRFKGSQPSSLLRTLTSPELYCMRTVQLTTTSTCFLFQQIVNTMLLSVVAPGPIPNLESTVSTKNVKFICTGKEETYSLIVN
jgi:hypothetical protein